MFDPLEFAAVMVSLVTFFVMQYKDTEEHRKYFFYSFSISLIAAWILVLPYIYETSVADEAVAK